MTIDITQVLVAIISVIGTAILGAIATYLLPWLKTKFTATQISIIQSLVYSGVKAAETLFTESGSGEKKFQYVMNTVQAFCEEHGITFDETAVTNEIQSVWQDLFSEDSTANSDK